MTALWLLVFVGGALYLAYHRVSLRAATLAAGIVLVTYSVIRAPATPWLATFWLVFGAIALLNVDAFRLRFITKPFLKTYRRMLPSMSDTEREALEAGTVWWDGELFTGLPDWTKLLSAQPPQAHRRGAGLPRRPVRRALPHARRLGHHPPARRPAARRSGTSSRRRASSR